MPELPEVETTVSGLKKKVLNRTFIDVWSDWEKLVRLRVSFTGAPADANPPAREAQSGALAGRSAGQVKKPKSFSQFKKELKGRKIKKVWRRAKNIIFDLSDDYSLLIHQKMTGHLLVGNWKLSNKNWEPVKKGPLGEKINLYIHLMFFLDDVLMIALSDVRKFAKIE